MYTGSRRSRTRFTSSAARFRLEMGSMLAKVDTI